MKTKILILLYLLGAVADVMVLIYSISIGNGTKVLTRTQAARDAGLSGLRQDYEDDRRQACCPQNCERLL
jgi:hypothetical protein